MPANTRWCLAASGLPAGVCEVTAYFWITLVDRFEDAHPTTVTVR